MTVVKKTEKKDYNLTRLSRVNQSKVYTVTVEDMWREYNHKKEDLMPRALYKGIVSTFFLEISKKIIYERHTFVMPFSIGTFLLKSFKITRPLEKYYKNTEPRKEKTKHYLLHSLGKVYRFIWENIHTRQKIKYLNLDKVPFKRFYKFKYANSLKDKRFGIGGLGIANYVMSTLKDPDKKLI